MRKAIVAMVVGLIMALTNVSPVSASTLSDSQYEARVQYQLNRVKVNHNLHTVRYGSCIDGVAERWASHLESQRSFYHQNLYPILYKCNAVRVGEILLRGDVSPRTAVRLWMNSPEHRRIIMDGRYRRIGVGVQTTPEGARYVAVDFLRH